MCKTILSTYESVPHIMNKILGSAKLSLFIWIIWLSNVYLHINSHNNHLNPYVTD